MSDKETKAAGGMTTADADFLMACIRNLTDGSAINVSISDLSSDLLIIIAIADWYHQGCFWVRIYERQVGHQQDLSFEDQVQPPIEGSCRFRRDRSQGRWFAKEEASRKDLPIQATSQANV